MIPGEFADITFKDIETLLEIGERESRTLECKRELPKLSDEGRKRDFVALVSSFANAAGGDIIYGIEEKKGEDGQNNGELKYFGLQKDLNFEKMKQQMESIISTLIAPKIPLVQIQLLENDENLRVVHVRITKSWLTPHMITSGKSAFYTRTTAGTRALDISEIKASILGSDQISTKVANFRNERVARILADETPFPLINRRRLVLHLYPLGLSEIDIPLSAVTKGDHRISPVGCAHPASRRVNVNGVLAYDLDSERNALCYLQAYRDGRIETVESGYSVGDEDRKEIFVHSLETMVWETLKTYMEFYKRWSVVPPVVVMMSLLNIRGATINLGSGYMSSRRPTEYTEPHLFLPEVLVDDFSITPEMFMRPAFDVLWNAFAFEERLPKRDR